MQLCKMKQNWQRCPRQCQCGAEGRCKDNDKEASRQSQHDAGAASQKVNADKDSLIGRTIGDNDNKENAGDGEDGIIPF